MTSQHQQTHN